MKEFNEARYYLVVQVCACVCPLYAYICAKLCVCAFIYFLVTSLYIVVCVCR